jgi:hypothetical protein
MTQADMHRPIRVLLQTTIPATPDDWHIGRFSLLKDHLVSLVSPHGEPLYDVVARDRFGDADDPVLSTLDPTGQTSTSCGSSPSTPATVSVTVIASGSSDFARAAVVC